jgi:anthranilate/para-aminobenzoate synthase component I
VQHTAASRAGRDPAGRVGHLRSRISRHGGTGVTLFDLLRALHPTPAVGGFPGPAALDWLAAPRRAAQRLVQRRLRQPRRRMATASSPSPCARP